MTTKVEYKEKDSLWTDGRNVYKADGNGTLFSQTNSKGLITRLEADMPDVTPYMEPGEAAIAKRREKPVALNDFESLATMAEELGGREMCPDGKWKDWVHARLLTKGAKFECDKQGKMTAMSADWSAYDYVSEEIGKFYQSIRESLPKLPEHQAALDEEQKLKQDPQIRSTGAFEKVVAYAALRKVPRCLVEHIFIAKNGPGATYTTDNLNQLYTDIDTEQAAMLNQFDKKQIAWLFEQPLEYHLFIGEMAVEEQVAQVQMDMEMAGLPAEDPKPSETTTEPATTAETSADAAPATPVEAAPIVSSEELAVRYKTAWQAAELKGIDAGKLPGGYGQHHGLTLEMVEQFEAAVVNAICPPEPEHVEAQPVDQEPQMPAVIKDDAGVIIDANTGEVLTPEEAFSQLGIAAERFEIDTEEKAIWFVGKIRELQLRSEDRFKQFIAINQGELRAYKSLMDYYTPQLRRVIEPMLPRHTGGKNAGKLKAKNWKCLAGTVFFKSTGGWYQRDRDAIKSDMKERVRKALVLEVIGLVEDFRDMKDAELEAAVNAAIKSPDDLLDPVIAEKYGIKLSARWGVKKLYALAEGGEHTEGIEKAPEHELGQLGIGGGGERAAWSFSKVAKNLRETVKVLQARLAGLAYGASDDDDEDDE